METRIKHKNIPFFIPHSGCGHSCVFCNQVKITGYRPCDCDVRQEVERLKCLVDSSLQTVGEAEAEIGFFGGSFTGIEPERRVALLETAHAYIREGKVSGIRLSTRPDYISTEILDELEAYGVTAVELGMQSTDGKVLEASARGHGVSTCFEAARLITERGFELVGQMMIGLPLSDLEKELKTANDIVSMGAAGARIYPTVVFEGTELYNMTLRGDYIPLSFEDAVERSAKCLSVFEEAGVKILRIGLHSSPNLSLAPFGANHPAIGEAVYSRLALYRIEDRLNGGGNASYKGKVLRIYTSADGVSAAAGYGGENKKTLKEKYGFRQIKVLIDGKLERRKVRIEVEG